MQTHTDTNTHTRTHSNVQTITWRLTPSWYDQEELLNLRSAPKCMASLEETLITAVSARCRRKWEQTSVTDPAVTSLTYIPLTDQARFLSSLNVWKQCEYVCVRVWVRKTQRWWDSQGVIFLQCRSQRVQEGCGFERHGGSAIITSGSRSVIPQEEWNTARRYEKR